MVESAVKGEQVSVERSLVGLVKGQTTTLHQSAGVVVFDTGTTQIKQGAAVAAGSWGDMSISMGCCVGAVAAFVFNDSGVVAGATCSVFTTGLK